MANIAISSNAQKIALSQSEKTKQALSKRAKRKFINYPLVRALNRIENTPNEKEYKRMLTCSGYAIVNYNTGTYNFTTCKSKLCLVCANIRSMVIYNKVAPLLKGTQVMLTLTVPNVSLDEYSAKRDEMKNTINDMVKFFKRYHGVKMRGFWCKETTYNAAKNTLHPHIHMVINWESAMLYIPPEISNPARRYDIVGRMHLKPWEQLETFEYKDKNGRMEKISQGRYMTLKYRSKLIDEYWLKRFPDAHKAAQDVQIILQKSINNETAIPDLFHPGYLHNIAVQHPGGIFPESYITGIVDMEKKTLNHNVKQACKYATKPINFVVPEAKLRGLQKGTELYEKQYAHWQRHYAKMTIPIEDKIRAMDKNTRDFAVFGFTKEERQNREIDAQSVEQAMQETQGYNLMDGETGHAYKYSGNDWYEISTGEALTDWEPTEAQRKQYKNLLTVKPSNK